MLFNFSEVSSFAHQRVVFVAVAIAIDHLKWFYKLFFLKLLFREKVNLSVLGSELPLVLISYSEFSQNFCFLALRNNKNIYFF